MHFKKVNKKNKGILPKSSITISNDLGVPELFKHKDNEALQLEYAKQVFDFRDTHNGKLPDKRSKDKIEAYLGVWVIMQTRIKKEYVYGSL